MAQILALGAGGALIFALLGLFGCAFCKDGWITRSFGRRGACSWHGGVDKD